MDGGSTTEPSSQQRLLDRCRHEEDTLVEVACVLRNRLLRSGLPDVTLPAQPQRCRLVRDPYDGSSTLIAEWRKSQGKPLGSVVIHENGQLFAELDVLQPLPHDPSWFVDAVIAFGTPGELRTELRLTPALS